MNELDYELSKIREQERAEADIAARRQATLAERATAFNTRPQRVGEARHVRADALEAAGYSPEVAWHLSAGV